MAKTALEQWDETAASNTDVGSNNIDEGNSPSTINNAIRETMSQIAKWIGDDTVASATTADLGAVPGRYINITGTTTITGLGTIKAGTVKYVKFAGALTLTHNATSLILPGAANITTIAGDTAIFVSEGSGNWRCLNYSSVASGTWTPALTCGTSGTITLTSPTDSMKYTRRSGLITLTGQIVVDSVSSPSGTLSLTGLPFANGNANGNYTAVALWATGYTGSANSMLEAFISQGASAITISNLNLSTGSTGANPSAMITAGTTIAINVTYSMT